MRPTLVAFTLLVATAGCGNKSKDASSCKPLSVTIDGKAVVLGHALGRHNTGTSESWEVDVFNHDKVTCEQYMNKSGRPVADGEVNVRAFAGGDGMMGKGVGIGANTQAGKSVELVGDPPKAKGEPISICVDNVSFKGMVGEYKDKPIVIDGLFQAASCGDMAF